MTGRGAELEVVEKLMFHQITRVAATWSSKNRIILELAYLTTWPGHPHMFLPGFGGVGHFLLVQFKEMVDQDQISCFTEKTL